MEGCETEALQAMRTIVSATPVHRPSAPRKAILMAGSALRGTGAQVGKVLGVSAGTVYKHRQQLAALQEGGFQFSAAIHRRSILSEETIRRIWTFLQRPSLSTVSPCKKHEVRGTRWHFLRQPLYKCHALFLDHEASYLQNALYTDGSRHAGTISLCSFYRVARKFTWLRRHRNLAGQRLICCCIRHVGFKWLLDAANRILRESHKDIDTVCTVGNRILTVDYLRNVLCCPPSDDTGSTHHYVTQCLNIEVACGYYHLHTSLPDPLPECRGCM